MTQEQFERLKELEQEIKRIEDFQWNAVMYKSGLITYVKNKVLGIMVKSRFCRSEDKEYSLNDSQRDDLHNIIAKWKKDLKDEYDSILNE